MLCQTCIPYNHCIAMPLVQIIEPSLCNESRVDFKPLKFLCSRIVGTGRPPSHLNTAFEFFFFENVKVEFF